MRKYPARFGKGVTEKAREGPRRYPTSFGNRWLEKYCPAILQEGLCPKKAENITA